MYGLYLVLENGFNFLQKYKQFPLISSFYSDYSLYINPIDFSRDKDGNCKLSYEIINDGNQTIKIISHYIVREYINTTERTATKIIDIESIGPTYSAPVQKTFPLGYWHPFTDSKIVDSLQKINEALAIYLVSDSITIVIKKDTLSIKNQIGKGIIYDESNIQVFPITKSKILIYD